MNYNNQLSNKQNIIQLNNKIENKIKLLEEYNDILSETITNKINQYIENDSFIIQMKKACFMIENKKNKFKINPATNGYILSLYFKEKDPLNSIITSDYLLLYGFKEGYYATKKLIHTFLKKYETSIKPSIELHMNNLEKKENRTNKFIETLNKLNLSKNETLSQDFNLNLTKNPNFYTHYIQGYICGIEKITTEFITYIS